MPAVKGVRNGFLVYDLASSRKGNDFTDRLEIKRKRGVKTWPVLLVLTFLTINA